MTTRIWLLSLIVAFSPFARGQDTFRIGTGVLSYNAFKNTTRSDAATDALGTNYYLPLQLQARLSLLDQDFGPRLIYTPLAEKSPEKGSSSTVLIATLPWLYQTSSSLGLSVGLGYMIRTIKGAGGTVQLNNGLGTSTFSLPGGTVSSKNLTTEFGIEWDRDSYALAFDAVFTSLLSERRSISFLLTLNYKL